MLGFFRLELFDSDEFRDRFRSLLRCVFHFRFQTDTSSCKLKIINCGFNNQRVQNFSCFFFESSCFFFFFPVRFSLSMIDIHSTISIPSLVSKSKVFLVIGLLFKIFFIVYLLKDYLFVSSFSDMFSLDGFLNVGKIPKSRSFSKSVGSSLVL